MSSLNRFIRGNLLSSPFYPQKKPIAPVVAAGLISAGASVASGVGSAISNSSLNKENRKWQSEENAKARNFEREMWERTNAYNTPLNQRNLLEQGGYNPYLYGDDGAPRSGASMAGSPPVNATPSNNNENPLQGLGSAGDIYAQFQQLAQQQQQIDANKSLQYIQGMEKLFDIQLKAYKEGGQKLVDQIQKQYSGVFEALDWSGSFYEQRLRKEFLSMDIANDRSEIARQVERMYSKENASAVLDNLYKTGDVLKSQVELMNSEERWNDAQVERVASEIARNFAEAFKVQKEGQYYVVSAEQMSIINKMMDMQRQEAEADFAFNTAVRKFKKQIPNRDLQLSLFRGSLGAQSVGQSIQGNAFLQNFKEFSGAVGNMFKVNFGLSSNRTNFNNLTPNSGSKMFYSGDGYYMNNGVLMKGSW